jgi:hypothetical protein
MFVSQPCRPRWGASAVSRWLLFSLPLDWVGEWDEQAFMKPSEMILGQPPIEMFH